MYRYEVLGLVWKKDNKFKVYRHFLLVIRASLGLEQVDLTKRQFKMTAWGYHVYLRHGTSVTLNPFTDSLI